MICTKCILSMMFFVATVFIQCKPDNLSSKFSFLSFPFLGQPLKKHLIAFDDVFSPHPTKGFQRQNHPSIYRLIDVKLYGANNLSSTKTCRVQCSCNVNNQKLWLLLDLIKSYLYAQRIFSDFAFNIKHSKLCGIQSAK